jgi:hypothetical protein
MITHVEISYREIARTEIARHKRNAYAVEILSWAAD